MGREDLGIEILMGFGDRDFEGEGEDRGFGGGFGDRDFGRIWG